MAPYDPRPVTEGGNREIDITFTRVAPAGKFKIVWVDTFDGSDGLVYNDDYTAPLLLSSLDEAIEVATAQAGSMNMRYVYDDQGKCVFSAGTF